ncbi:MAG: hypothetical protein PHG44_00345 [Lentisphaeria bacterium]|jgi:alpha-L-rhamnosidase|nr:hypothetical protein [Lentisphaeria bacterium]MDY0175756.1 hypothetical protein [Lentisphaeria bacterium]NLZ59919.1 hypothetical protein [Lentisphaerota bacterium]
MIKQLIEPRLSHEDDPALRFYDFGRHAFARLVLETESAVEQEIQIAVGEVAHGGRLCQAPGGSRIYQEQTLVLKPGRQQYQMHMRHPGYGAGSLKVTPELAPFRYAELRGLQNAKARVWQEAFFGPFDDGAALFQSSDEALNQVWEFCKYSMKATNVFGIFVDGNRERQAYEGDTIINQLGYFCCDRHYDIAKNTIDRLFAYPTWPCEWALSMPMIVRDYLLYTGDLDNVRRWYPELKPKLLLEMADESLLISAENQIPGQNRLPGFAADMQLRDLIDWPQGERDGYEMGKYNLVPNCWHYGALVSMAELAGFLSYGQERQAYAQRAALLRQAINQSMLKNNFYVDNPQSAHCAIHSLIFPLAFAVAPESLRPKLGAELQKRGMACSVFAAQFLLEACYGNRMAHYAHSLLTSDSLRSWRNMLRNGATISMEAWDDRFKPNQDWNHAWGAAPANIIPRHLAGIRPITPGYDKFILDPQPGPLREFQLRLPSRHGQVELQVRDKKAYLQVPSGSTAVYRGRELEPGSHELDLR